MADGRERDCFVEYSSQLQKSPNLFIKEGLWIPACAGMTCIAGVKEKF